MVACTLSVSSACLCPPHVLHCTQSEPERVERLPPGHPDAALIGSLLAGEEAAFEGLVDRYHASFVRLARAYVSTLDVAEEVAQEAWMAVLRGLPRFQGRSSLKNWMFRILTNRAKTRGVREGRTVPMSTAFEDAVGDPLGDMPDGTRFDVDGRWLREPVKWSARSPERRLLGDETFRLVREVVDQLPDKQRAVITMRDLEGLSSREVRAMLDLSPTYQRVLLHRARRAVREALATHVG